MLSRVLRPVTAGLFHLLFLLPLSTMVFLIYSFFGFIRCKLYRLQETERRSH